MIFRSHQSRTRLLFSSLVLLLIFILSGCNQDGTTLSDNQQPRAMITGSEVYTSGEIVTLDGSSSSDPDGDTLSYKWLRMEGQDIIFLNASTATLSFVAPTVSRTTRFTYKLLVGDGLFISSASVSIQVSPPVPNTPSNQQPIAIITGSNVYSAGQIVTLDGSSSSDPNADTLSYYWVRTEGPDTVPSVASTATLSFVAPTVSQITRITYKLSVGDGQLSSTSSASIQVSPSAPNTPTNQLPSAKITAPQSVLSGQAVTLNGSGSSDPDGDTISYQWTQTGGPGITLSDNTGPNLTFVVPSVVQPQQISFQLTVRDGKLANSTSVRMLISPIVDKSAPSIVFRFP